MGFLSEMRDRWRRIGIFSLAVNGIYEANGYAETPRLSEEIERLKKEVEIAVVAEYKRASPTGIINLGLDIRDYYYQLHRYVAGFSVIVEREWFSGSPGYIVILRRLGWRGPILAKGFVFYKEQIDLYRGFGASSVLLIADALDSFELRELYLYSESLGIEPLVEISDAGSLERVMKTLSPRIIGINARNLETLEISINNMLSTIQYIRKEYPDLLIVAESGVKDLEDLLKAREAGADAYLIGTILMKREDRGAMLSHIYLRHANQRHSTASIETIASQATG